MHLLGLLLSHPGLFAAWAAGPAGGHQIRGGMRADHCAVEAATVAAEAAAPLLQGEAAAKRQAGVWLANSVWAAGAGKEKLS